MRFIPELSADTNRVILEKEAETYEICSGTFGRYLRARRRLNENTIKVLREKGIKNLEIDTWDLEEHLDLNVLTLMPELESLSLLSEKPIDWTPIQGLKRIQKLILIARKNKPQFIDFKNFRHLHTAHVTWHQEWASVLSCGAIRGLTIQNSKGMPELDLRGLPKLSELDLKGCSGLRRVNCAPAQKLESLSIDACRSFESVEPRGVLNALKYVGLYGNSRFEIESLGRSVELRRLRMFGVGKIRSLNFLSNCPKLERIAMHFSTQVEDGDLRILLDLPIKHVSFKRHRNYTHTLEEIKAHHRIS